MAVSVPVRVQGHDRDGVEFAEMTTTAEAGFGGTSFRVRHPLEPGQVVLLSLPLPKAFRRYDLGDASYRVYALVRDTVVSEGVCRAGVCFLGKTPPKGYAENPTGRYLLPTDPPPKPRERRRHPRLDVFLNLTLQRSQLGSAPAQSEQTVAENLSKRGARVMTSLPVAKGEIVTVQELGGSFRTTAEVMNVYIGPDQIPRLNLCFKVETPDRLIPR